MSFFACLFLVDQLHSVFLWVMEAGGVVGFISSVWALRRSLKAKSKAACEFEAEAVTRRARLLVQAEYAYKVYAEQYRLWHENVDGKPSAGELPKAERFYQFLVIVHHVLVKAFKNFERTSALADLRKNYLEEHGASGVAKADVALVEIMSQLNAPIELPESLLLPDPADALSREEAVAEVIADLDKEAPVFGLLPVNRSE